MRAHRREELQLREPLVGDLGRQPDVELDLQRSRDLLVEEPAERAVRRVDVADQLLHVEPDRHRVVAVSRPRRPRRLLPREHTRDVVEVAQVLDVQRLVEPNQPRLVAEELAHGDRALAVLGELGPVLGDRRVVVEPAARVRDRERHRREALGGRDDDDHRVLVPRRVAVGCAAATPQVDDLLAAPIRGDGGADLAALGEVALELGAHLLEARSDPAAAMRCVPDGFRRRTVSPSGRVDPLRWHGSTS